MLRPDRLRITALLIAFLAGRFLPAELFISILIALTFSHYVMAASYSRVQLRHHWESPPGRLRIFVLAAGIVLASAADWPHMILVFGFHHIFNERALLDRAGAPQEAFLERCLSYLFETAVYAAIVLPDIGMLGIGPLAIHSRGLMIMLVSLWVVREGLSAMSARPRTPVMLRLFDLAGLLTALGALASGVGGLDFVLYYHFTYWALGPLSKRMAEGPRAVVTYASWTGLSFLAALVFTPSFVHAGGLSIEALSRLTRIGGYFHIISSLAVSSSHPTLIRKLFGAESGGVAARASRAGAKAASSAA